MESTQMQTQTQTPQTQVDNRPSDVDVFLGLLPTLVGSFAGKNSDPKSCCDLAINLARQTLGGLCQLGICRAQAWCTDGQPLALGLPPVQQQQMTAQYAAAAQGLGNGFNKPVVQFPSQQTQRVQGL